GRQVDGLVTLASIIEFLLTEELVGIVDLGLELAARFADRSRGGRTTGALAAYEGGASQGREEEQPEDG
ncbi:MAG: hypothetical protein ACJA2W_003578, partial [Planctomycetota bacterium]